MPSRPTCEFCNAAAAVHEHHIAQGTSREDSDVFDELKLSLCLTCHNDIHEQKAKREIGLALVVRAGRASLARVVNLFWLVTRRQYPPMAAVRKWVERLDNTRS